ncbi:MAG: DEAD/DEAH box helicase, partial [Novosphingobium sp. 35-62-5]
KFKDGEITILCASDVAARGLDVKGVSHVFNFDTPWHPDDYVHRIGRTGRGGAMGRAFTLVADDDLESIENVEKLQGTKIPEFKIEAAEKAERKPRAVKAEVEASAEPKRARRSERPAREEREAQPEREASPERSAPVEREVKPAREPRAARPPRGERTYRDQAEPLSKPGEWNGPVPEFLGVSAL